MFAALGWIVAAIGGIVGFIRFILVKYVGHALIITFQFSLCLLLLSRSLPLFLFTTV